MDYLRFIIFTLCLSAWVASEVTPLDAASAARALSSTTPSNTSATKEPELKDNNPNQTLVNIAKKDESNTPKIRRVSQLNGFGEIDKNSKPIAVENVQKSSTSAAAPTATTAATKLHPVQVSDGVVVNVPLTNVNSDNKTIGENKKSASAVSTNATNTAQADKSTPDLKIIETHINNNASELTTVENATKSLGNITNSAANETIITPVSNSSTSKSIKLNLPSSTTASTITTTKTPSVTSTAASTKATTTSSTSSTTTTSTTTTTTTTPRPKKPKVTYGVEDFPDLDKESLALHNLTQQKESLLSPIVKLPLPEAPYAQPSQEFSNTTFHGGRDYILPIVSMIFIIPLVIGIMITTYRRFRDCWSTRHYRRMDFLVDGMYND